MRTLRDLKRAWNGEFHLTPDESKSYVKLLSSGSDEAEIEAFIRQLERKRTLLPDLRRALWPILIVVRGVAVLTAGALVFSMPFGLVMAFFAEMITLARALCSSVLPTATAVAWCGLPGSNTNLTIAAWLTVPVIIGVLVVIVGGFGRDIVRGFVDVVIGTRRP